MPLCGKPELRASSTADRDEGRLPQGRQTKEICPRLFSVEKILEIQQILRPPPDRAGPTRATISSGLEKRKRGWPEHLQPPITQRTRFCRPSGCPSWNQGPLSQGEPPLPQWSAPGQRQSSRRSSRRSWPSGRCPYPGQHPRSPGRCR